MAIRLGDDLKASLVNIVMATSATLNFPKCLEVLVCSSPNFRPLGAPVMPERVVEMNNSVLIKAPAI